MRASRRSHSPDMRIGLTGSVVREIPVLPWRAILRSSAGNGFTRMTDHARCAWRATQTTTSWQARSSIRRFQQITVRLPAMVRQIES
jgi:hypothetical protein